MQAPSRLTLAQRAAYLGGSLSVGVYSAFNNYTMSLWLSGFTTSYVLISLLGNSRSVEGSVISPLAGAWSDRIWVGWLGRRRPFILAGGLASAALMAATPAISRASVPLLSGVFSEEFMKLTLIVAAIVLFTLTFNLGDDLHKALRADLTDGAELNLLSSLATIVDIAAQVGILVLGFLIWSDAVPDSAFAVAGALVALGALVTTLGIREPPPSTWAERKTMTRAEPPGQSGFRSLWTQYRGAAMFCLVTFAYWSGVNAVLPLVSIYVRDILGASVGEAQLLPGLLLLSTTLMALPVGWLGTRFGKLRVLGGGYAIMGAAAVAGLLITTREQGAVLFLLAGIGNSATVVLAIPILADLVPKQRMGTATGLLAAASSIAAPLASLAAGSLAQFYGPRAIFAVMAVMVVLAIALLAGVRSPRQPQTV